MDEQALIESLGNDFVQDLVDNRLSFFHNLLLELENEGDAAVAGQEVYEELFRRFHGAKGTGGIFGMYSISTVFHQLENYLTLLKSPGDHNKPAVFIKMHRELDLVEKMALAWLAGERDLRKLMVEDKASLHSNEFALVLEPMKSLANQIIATLQSNGYETTLVQDGVQAIQHLVSRPFDVFVTSEQNKYINGSELIGFMKMTPRFSTIKTIYLTTDNRRKWSAFSPDIIIKKDSSLLESFDMAVS